jgi:hypothetical protein
MTAATDARAPQTTVDDHHPVVGAQINDHAAYLYGVPADQSGCLESGKFLKLSLWLN